MSPTGATIMGVFAAVWWLIGTVAPGRAPAVVYVLPLVVSGAIVAAGVSLRSRENELTEDERARRGRLVGLASAAEGVAILVAINVLVNVRKTAFAVPVVAIIVGLHFLPLARALPARLYYGTAALLVALGAAGFTIRAADARRLVVGVGAALVLWATSAIVLREGRARR